MSEKRNSGPVSGEIMSDGAGRDGVPRPRNGADDVVDAEYETVDAKAPAPSGADAARRARPGEAASGFDMLRPEAGAGAGANGAGRPARERRGGPLFWAFGLIAVLFAFWVSGGYALVGDRPFMGRTDGEGAEPALRIASLTSRVETRGGRSVLLVDGEAQNGGQRVRNLPRLSIDVLGKDGATTRYFLGTNSPALAPGEKFTFSSRLVAPKDGVESVSVTIGENED